jgi:hypothetical protein
LCSQNTNYIFFFSKYLARINLVLYTGDRKIGAVDVWQTSTYPGTLLFADLAADNNRDNTVHERCSHTSDYQSGWTMEFENEAEVSHVIVYFNYNEQFSKLL